MNFESPSLFYDLLPGYLFIIMLTIGTTCILIQSLIHLLVSALELLKSFIYYEFIITKHIFASMGIDIMKTSIIRRILLTIFPSNQNCVLMYEPILNFIFYFSSFIFGVVTRNRIHYIDDYLALPIGKDTNTQLNNCQYEGCKSLRAYYGYKNPVGDEKNRYYCIKHKEGVYLLNCHFTSLTHALLHSQEELKKSSTEFRKPVYYGKASSFSSWC